MTNLDENRLVVGKRLGATATVNRTDGTAAQQVMALTSGRGVDTAIEAMGIPATFTLCEDIVTAGGTIANVGGHGVRPTCTWSASGRTTSRSRLGRSIPMLLITHHVKLGEILRAYDTFSRAADTKALKVSIEA